jgi:CelD/BcsL family acetyltransferase involved in cellulose biosynthesis
LPGLYWIGASVYNRLSIHVSYSSEQKDTVSLEFTVNHKPTVFADLKDEWDDLLERSYAGSIFNTWVWNVTWWDVYQPGELWVVTCRDDDGLLLGIAPWFVSKDQERVLQTIGCRDVADYLDVLVDRDHTAVVLAQFARFLSDNRDAFDQIALCNIPEQSASLNALTTELEQLGFAVEIAHEDVCPIIQLPTAWDDYVSQLDKRNRHELRRKLRRARGNNQDTDWYIVGPEHDLDVEMDHFLELMASSDPEKAEFCADPNNQTFFRQIARRALEAGWLMLNVLTVNGDRAATYFNFDYKDQILVYNSGLNPDYAALSPGIVLISYNIQYAIEHKRKVFDFLQGNEEYKYRLGAEDTAVVNLNARALEG